MVQTLYRTGVTIEFNGSARKASHGLRLLDALSKAHTDVSGNARKDTVVQIQVRIL